MRHTDPLGAWAAAAARSGAPPESIACALASRLATARGLDPRHAEELLEAEPVAVAPPPVDDPLAIGDVAAAVRALRAADAWSRKRLGAIYTPPALARLLVARALADEQHAAPPTVCDPAAGAGVFLVAALDALRRRWPDVPAADLVRSALFGLDVDPDAVALARATLWLAAGEPGLAPRDLQSAVRCGDALLGIDATELGPGELDDRESRDAHGLALLAEAAGRSADLDALRWFHWDLELPQVFRRDGSGGDGSGGDGFGRGGFDVVVGNPPWDTVRLDAREFFGDLDPAQRERHTTESGTLRRQLLDADPELAQRWCAHRARIGALRGWLARRHGVSVARSDPNLALAFVDRALGLLRPGGRLAMLVPAALHTDLGARRLRARLLDEHRWRELIGFENRRRLFAGVDSRFKFDAILVQRGGRTDAIACRFLATDAASLDGSGARFELPARTVRRFHPRTLAIPEVDTAEDLALLDRAHTGGVPFDAAGPTGWGIAMQREFDLTRDAKHFRTRDDLERSGYVPDRFDRWLRCAAIDDAPQPADTADRIPLRDGRCVRSDDVADVWLPLLEGRHVAPFDDAAKGWQRGHGRRAVWLPSGGSAPVLEPRVLVSLDAARSRDPLAPRPKIGFMAIGSATNAHAMVAAVLVGTPAGNSVPTLRCSGPDGAVDGPPDAELALAAVLGSLVYDALLRRRMAGLNLNRSVLADTPLPRPDRALRLPSLRRLVADLSFTRPAHAAGWTVLRTAAGDPVPRPTRERLARTTRLAALDAAVAWTYGLDAATLLRLLSDCALPAELLRSPRHARTLSARGLWRIDRDRPPLERRTVLAVLALLALERRLAAVAPAAAAATVDAFLAEARDPGYWPREERVDLRALGFATPLDATAVGPAPERPAALPWDAATRGFASVPS
ncbi:MAG: N-6 DNA methylase [Planctomycetes bacterium]|nr:N-6 DNA methylase [Planctomycetota bacterium]